MTIRTALLSAVTFAGLALTAAPAAATVMVYTINATLSDGQTLTGSFKYNDAGPFASTGTDMAGYTDIALTVNGALKTGAQVYGASFNASTVGIKGFKVNFGYNNAYNTKDYLWLSFDVASASDFVKGIPASSTLAGTSRLRGTGGVAVTPALTSGTWSAAPASTVAAVPEPATWTLMLAGFGLTGAALRRRARTRVTFA